MVIDLEFYMYVNVCLCLYVFQMYVVKMETHECLFSMFLFSFNALFMICLVNLKSNFYIYIGVLYL